MSEIVNREKQDYLRLLWKNMAIYMKIETNILYQ